MAMQTHSIRSNVTSIIRKVHRARFNGATPETFEFDDLFTLLSPSERAMADSILKLNPRDFHIKGTFYGITSVPEELIKIPPHEFKRNGVQCRTTPQFVPKLTYASFKDMALKMDQESGRSILIESGYRSPAYQLVVFLRYFQHFDYDTQKALKRVALPGYSQHGYPPKQGLDFMTLYGSPSEDQPTDFAKTDEYEWLCKHAALFGFEIPYFDGNPEGISFEPWHWMHVNMS